MARVPGAASVEDFDDTEVALFDSDHGPPGNFGFVYPGSQSAGHEMPSRQQRPGDEGSAGGRRERHKESDRKRRPRGDENKRHREKRKEAVQVHEHSPPSYDPNLDGDEVTGLPTDSEVGDRTGGPPQSAGGGHSGEGPALGPLPQDPLRAPARVATLSDALMEPAGSEGRESRDRYPPNQAALDQNPCRSLLPAPQSQGVVWQYSTNFQDPRRLATSYPVGMIMKVWIEPQPALPKLKDAAIATFLVCGYSQCPGGASTCTLISWGQETRHCVLPVPRVPSAERPEMKDVELSILGARQTASGSDRHLLR